jgi:hypothetical protein
MIIRCVRSHCQRQAVTIANGHDFHARSASGRPNLIFAARCGCKRGIDEAFRLIDRACFTRHIRQLGECSANHLVVAPLLKAPVLRVHSTASKTLRAGIGLRPRRSSGICSSGKCFRISSDCSSVMRSTQEFCSFHTCFAILSWFPVSFWRRAVTDVRATLHPLFAAAWTLGCRPAGWPLNSISVDSTYLDCQQRCFSIEGRFEPPAARCGAACDT